MNAPGWLRERNEGVPHALTEALQDGAAAGGNEHLSDALMHAAGRQLSKVLESTPMTRAQALGLLTADAFATYAFEAAADEPGTLGARADAAMKHFADQVRA